MESIRVVFTCGRCKCRVRYELKTLQTIHNWIHLCDACFASAFLERLATKGDI